MKRRLLEGIFLILLASCGDSDSTDAAVVDAAELDAEADAAEADAAELDVADVARVDPGFVDPSTLGLEVDPPGRWLRGDFHVHATGASNDTGGDSTPEAIKRVAMERGLFFVVLTDHSNSTGSDVTMTEENPELFNQGPEFPFWDRASELSEAGVFLMVDGNEISPVGVGDPPSTPSGHIGCIPMNLDTFDRSGSFIDRPRGEVSGRDALDQANARSCFSIVNHPYAFAPWIAFDWSVGEPGWEYQGVEVWNGTLGFGQDDQRALDLWRCDLLAGRNVAAIAASDNHRVNTDIPGMLTDPALGYPSTEVFAEEPTWAGIMAGLRAGRTQFSEGATRIEMDGYSTEGERTRGGNLHTIRLRGSLDEAVSSGTLRVTRANSCIDARPLNDPPVIDETVLLEYELRAGESLDVGFLISDLAPGVYLASLVPASGRFAAYSAPLVVPFP
ncbi:MAG: CehA/McbA family metallohydrolase [Polyangiales bacterium]